MLEDKSFKQALEERTAFIAKDIRDAAQLRFERLLEGATVAEVTADIEDQHMRSAVSDLLLYLRVDTIISSMETLGILDRKQIDELRAYLNDRMIPSSE